MEDTALKIDLHDKIDHADKNQLKELYGLIVNYFNSSESVEEWDLLSESQKKLLNKSLEQADAGLGTPLKEINQRLRAKYGLNG
ncbi:hypothetical protein [Mucilaginibacter sp. OK098]|uniref:hypothetical protein n=1 Tax=Mucilaginibacter sp. OK098 TaxID=1855297 RepID=UPI00090EEA78|nr:hypothetical protein [Mucilaginibacter sp. OK098]SHN19199.1 hypothetical protein SAMN05216524_106275 [Mucilaginibacter sp. OK098]